MLLKCRCECGETFEAEPEGGHRIVCGDSTDAAVWTALALPARAAVFTSPPYGVGKTGLRDHHVPGRRSNPRKSLYAEHNDDPREWLALMKSWTENALRHCPAVICNMQMLARNKRAMVDWMMEFASNIVDVVVWDKIAGPPQMQPNILTNAFEWIFILSSAENASRRAIPFSKFHGTKSNIVRIEPKGGNDYAATHRAVMPVALAQWAVELMPRASAIVDPFAGSGTTVIAAEMTGRRAYAVELSPAYVDVAVERWQQFSGLVAVRHDGVLFSEASDGDRMPMQRMRR
jgi:DNA modification methylase